MMEELNSDRVPAPENPVPETAGTDGAETAVFESTIPPLDDAPKTEEEIAAQLEAFAAAQARSEELSDYGEPSLGMDAFPALPAEPPVIRTPNLIDASLLLAFLVLGLLVTTGLLGVALHFHWLGLRSFDQAAKSTWVALATQLLVYVLAFGVAVPFFAAVWGRRYLPALHWHGSTAYRVRYRLVAVAAGCNVLAMAGNWLLPFPDHAPIDAMFNTPADAWMLAGFGVLIAPIFEEMIFRGFLLPAMATAWDWCGEKFTGAKPRPLDSDGNPAWSLGAMIFAALAVSAPFAGMHAAQVGQAWGPIVLLYCVSLIFCAVRLVTRSLAASTLTHSAYNLMLFGAMFVETGGFRHMDKM